jgi:ribosomal protein L15
MKFKKKKVRRQRASTFHGWGRGAAHHKGAGNRGGRGRSGSGKKADQKKPSYWHEPVGKRGFASKSRFHLEAINLSDIERLVEEWVIKGYASKSGKGYEIDLPKAGYGKLLGTGKPSVALMIKTDFASAGAVEKVKQAGGSVSVLKTKIKKEKKAAPKKKTDE